MREREEEAYLFDLRTATSPLGNAYEPSGVAINIGLGIPVGGFTFLMSKVGSRFVGQC